ncbi:MAG: leucyl aminopeptidase [Nitrospira sp.]|nr:leucyl aminopeptidase [Nitrospira sp.]
MNVVIKNLKENDCACDALILPFTEGDKGLYNNLDISLSSLIKKSFSKEFSGKQNELLLLPAPMDTKPERILLAGLGKKDKISKEKVRQAGGKSAVFLRDMGMKKIALSTRALSSLKMSATDFIEGSLLGLYTFKKYIHENKTKKINSLILLSKITNSLKADLHRTETVASSVNFARDLINTPANDMTPSRLADAAGSLKRKNLTVKIFEKKECQRLGMGSYLSVAYGSNQPPKFIMLHYHGAKGAPVVLIGKSITFDSGGISIKPADGMEKMKYDMAGGAAVLGIIRAASELKLPVNLIGILPATENLSGGSATRPGDVVRAINGKTIEIISTDAEGRMTLADAIGYAKRLKPAMIIDLATLTGACSIALGNVAIAMMGNDRDLVDKLKKSGDNTYERVWEMPLFEESEESLKSDIADLKNTGGKSGSLISSAYFLYEFAGDTPWVHLDIAGTAWIEKEKPYMPKGASGIGVRLILDLIKGFK